MKGGGWEKTPSCPGQGQTGPHTSMWEALGTIHMYVMVRMCGAVSCGSRVNCQLVTGLSTLIEVKQPTSLVEPVSLGLPIECRGPTCNITTCRTSWSQLLCHTLSVLIGAAVWQRLLIHFIFEYLVCSNLPGTLFTPNPLAPCSFLHARSVRWSIVRYVGPRTEGLGYG